MKKYRLISIVVFLVFAVYQFCFGQASVDSVQYEIADTLLVRNLLEEGKALAEKFEWEEALEKVNKAKIIYEHLNKEESKQYIDILHQIASINYYQGKYKEAIKIWEKRLAVSKKVYKDSHKDLATSYHNLGNAYNFIGVYDSALICLNKSINIYFDIYGKEHLDMAQTYNSIGGAFSYLGEYDKSIENYVKALEIRESAYGPEHPDIGRSYHNIGDAYRFKGDYVRSLDYLNKGKRILTKNFGGRHPDLAVPYTSLADVYGMKGEPITAIEYYKNSLDIISKTYGENHPYIATPFNGLGNAYGLIGDFKKAIYYYEKSIDILVNAYGEQHAFIARSFQSIAICHEHNGDFSKASDYYIKSINLYEKTLGSKHLDLALAYNNYGYSFIGKKKYEEAIQYLEKAHEIYLSISDEGHPDIARVKNNFSLIYLLKNENEKSIKFAEESMLLSGYSNTQHMQLIAPEYFLYSLNLLVQNHLKLSQYMESHALKSYDFAQIAFSAFDQHYLSLTDESSKSFWQNRYFSVFEQAISTSLLRSIIDKDETFKKNTFAYAEKSKATLLQLQLKAADALRFSNLPDSMLEKEYNLRIDITYYDKKRQEKLSAGLEETDTTVLAISSKLFDLNREYEALKERFETDYPDYYKLKYDLSTVSLGYVQDTLLAADQTLLEYFVGDSSIFIFTVGKDKYDVVEVKRDFQLEDWVKQLQNGLTGYYTQPLAQRTDDLYKETIQQYIEASQQLYGKLVAPVKEKLSTSELIIVPDGLLGYVPFGALLSGQPKRASVFDTYPFLEKDYKISYCYSATLLREMKEKQHKRQPTGSLVAFAPFYEGSYELLDTTFSLTFDTLANGQDTLIFNDVVTRKDFNNLPASGEEVKAASLFWNGDYYLNADATEDRFNEVAGNYRIVHLSTHGVADSRSGDYSYLAFAEQKDSIENELLYVRDLYNIQLNADLVTLSACETSAGELQRGEGIISLARAFAYSGAKSIVTTLWVADDAATRDLMKTFYQQLKNGEEKEAALQKAKLKLQESRNYVHPFFWAAMIPVGDMSPMK